MPSQGDVGRHPQAAIAHSQPDAPQSPGAGQPAKVGGWGQCCQWLSRCCSPCCRRGSQEDEVEDGTVEDGDGGRGEGGEDGQLRVMNIDLLRDREDVNKQRHHTSEFETEELIVRRGQPFNIKVVLNRAPDPITDKVVIVLRTGPNPQPAKGTEVTLSLVDQLEKGKWGAKVLGQAAGGKELSVSLQSPPTCPIGKYHLSVCPYGTPDPGQCPNVSLYILFNPWCPDDVVYLEDERMREEYVLNDTGRIYYGTEHQIGARTWHFGQFSKGILETSFYVLGRSKMPSTGRSDPVSVVRVISAMINAQDEGGVLEGNWSGDYRGGTPPTAWVGSVDILLQYHQNQRPVRYGQCWVFSAVVTTVLRSLGIATRSVTNFSSAHDTDVSLTNDVYLDEDMKPLDHLNYDSIWNFHVWNDCWMARPDLPVGLGGWQAIDATPQETSCGLYCCGPASVEAIRNGMVYLPFDSPFIFAEVNSDKVYWQRQADGTFQKVHVEKKVVGHKISTKAVGSDDREDITDSYKYPEGTDEERIAVVTASRHGSRPETYGSERTCDVDVVVSTDDGVIMGKDFTVTITVTNTSSESRSLTLLVQAVVMYYTGVVKGTFKKDKHDVLLDPHKEKELVLLFQHDDYLEFLVDQAAMKFTITGRVKETGQAIVKQHNFRLRTPDLRITPLGDARIGQVMKVEISVTNPLPKPLNNVTLRIEGPGLQNPRKLSIGDVPRHANVTVMESLVPVKGGLRKLIASLDCPQLSQVHGVTEILVQEN